MCSISKDRFCVFIFKICQQCHNIWDIQILLNKPFMIIHYVFNYFIILFIFHKFIIFVNILHFKNQTIQITCSYCLKPCALWYIFLKLDFFNYLMTILYERVLIDMRCPLKPIVGLGRFATLIWVILFWIFWMIGNIPLKSLIGMTFVIFVMLFEGMNQSFLNDFWVLTSVVQILNVLLVIWLDLDLGTK